MSATNALCPSCLPSVAVPAPAAAPSGWARWAAAWRAWRHTAAQRRVARLAASLSPGLRRDLGLHEVHSGTPEVHARALAEYDRMRW